MTSNSSESTSNRDAEPCGGLAALEARMRDDLARTQPHSAMVSLRILH